VELVRRSAIERRAEAIGVSVTPELAGRLEAYLSLLFRWNARMNLTAVRDEKTAVDRLLLEGVVAAELLEGSAPRVMDVGSGAGSPAIPMHLALAGSRLMLVEARQRKAAFLREAARVLGLERVTVAACRVEELPAQETVRADVVSSRGVRVDALLASTVGRLAEPEACWLVFGGEAPPGGGGWEVERSVELPGDDAGRLWLASKKRI